MQTVKAALVAAITIIALVVSLLPGLAEERGSLALTISINGAMGPAWASYVKTPWPGRRTTRRDWHSASGYAGRLDASMREIITDVLASPVPVIGYFAPPERMQASAGPTVSMRPISL